YESMQKVAKDYEYYGPDRTFTEQDPNTGESKSVTQPIQAGAVLIENNSGKIISFVGNREATVNDHFNYAMNAKRQPGSTFKPLAVFAPGMDLGILQPGTVIPDIPDGNANSPSNYGNGYYGLVSAREALTKSHNVSTTNAYKMIKDENPAKNYLRKMNLDLTKEHETIDSLALGTNDVSVEQNTSAFSTLGNEGKYADSYMIDKITTNDGDEVYEHELDPVDVFSPQAAYLTIDMMRDVLTQGTGTFVPAQLSNSGVDWAGKTGTSQDYRDAWFIGMNPNVTLGTWIGYETQASIWCDNCTYSYSQRNQKLWANLINKATEVNPELMAPKEQFKEPENIVTRNYCAISGLAPSKLCSDAGLVTSDIYDSKYVPSKKDDSLVGQSGKAKLVLVKDKEVVAGDKTPSEFTFSGKSSGYAFNPEFLKANGYDKLGDLSVLFPRTNRDAWEKISVSGSKNVASSSIKDDGKPPAKPGDIKAKGEKISWGASSGNVVGYRIYKGSNKIDSTTSTSFTLPQGDGKYSVKAVDYFGRESSASNEIKVSVEKDDKKAKDKDQKKDNKKEDKDKDKKEKDKKEKEDKEDKDKKEKDKKEKEDKDKKEKDEKEKKEKEKEEKEKKEKEKKDKENKEEKN
ncbi:MAG TPA: penicillin-binding transpeptidase domain-containing protein, partial [Pseudogracilibacillus sp.]|nr:penicillin-binding transpeptidase domain-containing protein [Pseudogracilibacillus sp.]